MYMLPVHISSITWYQYLVFSLEILFGWDTELSSPLRSTKPSYSNFHDEDRRNMIIEHIKDHPTTTHIQINLSVGQCA
jgi:hypothetical protein